LESYLYVAGATGRHVTLAGGSSHSAAALSGARIGRSRVAHAMRYAALKSAGIPMNTAPQPLVTVVTPMYNNVQYVKECIQSDGSQTYRDCHYVMVNNCSTDGSAD